MFPKHRPNKPDPFIVLILIVVVGVSATIAYQLHVYDINHFLNVRSAQNVPLPNTKNLSSNFRER
jgi:hypothetical protein